MTQIPQGQSSDDVRIDDDLEGYDLLSDQELAEINDRPVESLVGDVVQFPKRKVLKFALVLGLMTPVIFAGLLLCVTLIGLPIGLPMVLGGCAFCNKYLKAITGMPSGKEIREGRRARRVQ